MSVTSSQLTETVRLELYQGQPFAAVLTVTDASGALQDFTGCTAEAMLRATVQTQTVIDTWSTDDGTLVLGGTAGTITFAVPVTSTSAYPTGDTPQTWFSDIFVTSAGGIPQRICGIIFDVWPAVTRTTP